MKTGYKIENFGGNLTENTVFHKNTINELLRSEVFKVLDCYLELDKQRFFSDISIDENGEFVFRCKLFSKRLRVMGFLKEGRKV